MESGYTISMLVYWLDENGHKLSTFSDTFNHWDYIKAESEYDGTCCLRFIDEYGDTTFNTLQIPTLLGELESLLPKSKNEAAKAKLELLLEFIRQADGKIHTYIKFFGD